MPARRARGAGVLGGYSFEPSSDLVFKALGEEAPSLVLDAPVEAAFLGDAYSWLCEAAASRSRHVSNLKVFDADRVVFAGETRRKLFDEVFLPIDSSMIKAGEVAFGRVAAFRAFSLACEFTFQT